MHASTENDNLPFMYLLIIFSETCTHASVYTYDWAEEPLKSTFSLHYYLALQMHACYIVNCFIRYVRISGCILVL